MTVPNSVFSNEHAGTGEATTFDYEFKVFQASDMTVYHYDVDGNENVLVYNTDYTISNIGENGGGEITFPIGGSSYGTLSVGETLFIVPNYTSTQLASIQNQGGFYPKIVENALDKLTGLIKTLEQKVARTVLIDHLNGLSANDVVTFIKDMASNLAATITYKDAAAASASSAAASAASIDIPSVNTVAADLNGDDTVGTVATNIASVLVVAADLSGTNAITVVAADLAGDNNIDLLAGYIDDINTVATNIVGVNSFAERYRIAAADPSLDNDEGDLCFNTTSKLLKYFNGTSWQSIAPGIGSLADDASPQLGGNLDVSNYSIISVSNQNVNITPHGTGAVVLKGLTMPVADGTAGQAMVTDGAGNISFANVSGGLVLLGSYTATNATSVDIGSGLDLDVAIDDTYDEYILKIYNAVPATDNVRLAGRVRSGGSFVSTYTYRSDGAGTINNFVISTQVNTNNNLGTAAGETVVASVHLYTPSNTSFYKLIRAQLSIHNALDNPQQSDLSTTFASTAAVDGLRIYMTSGNIASAQFYLYGVKKS